jgi:Leucine-rich repeat (LRR) protein
MSAFPAVHCQSTKILIIFEILGNLKSLTELGLSSNQLTTVPDALDNLKNLTQLGLGSNQLTTVPDALGNLKSLTVLNLGSNQLTTVPDALGNLKQFHGAWNGSGTVLCSMELLLEQWNMLHLFQMILPIYNNPILKASLDK